MIHIYLRRLWYRVDRKCKYILMFPHLNAATLRWRHNVRDSVSNHQPHHCLLSRLFRRRSKKTSKRCVTGLCLCGEFTGDRWIPRTNGQSRGKCFHLMTSSSWRKRFVLWQTCDESSRTIPQRGVYVVKHGELLVAKIYGLLWMPIQNDFISGVAIWNSEMSVSFISINSLVPGATIWRNRFMSTVLQVMAWWLTPPSHYLNQWWLIISKVHRHSYLGNFTRDASTINH